MVLYLPRRAGVTHKRGQQVGSQKKRLPKMVDVITAALTGDLYAQLAKQELIKVWQLADQPLCPLFASLLTDCLSTEILNHA